MQDKELINEEVEIEEVELDEKEIIEESITPAVGFACGLGCVGSICGIVC